MRKTLSYLYRQTSKVFNEALKFYKGNFIKALMWKRANELKLNNEIYYMIVLRDFLHWIMQALMAQRLRESTTVNTIG